MSGLTNGISNSASALRANEYRLATIANNITNATTKNFRALDYTQIEGNGGNVIPVVNQSPQAAVQVIDADGNVTELSNVSLESELVEAQLTVNAFTANATVLSVQSKLLGNFLDIVA